MKQSFQLQSGPELGRLSCSCERVNRVPELIAITGGPGAGKTAVLYAAANSFCSHVAFLPEAATLAFSGGFWRRPTVAGLRSAQRAIFHIQAELEAIFLADQLALFGLCDRGTVDGFAYWPNETQDYWTAMGTTREAELKRYRAVIHLRTPRPDMGYDTSNPARIESAEQARVVDEKIADAWRGHPARFEIKAEGSFQTKIDLTLRLLEDLMASKDPIPSVRSSR